MLERGRVVQQGIEDGVVPRAAQIELLTDRSLLATLVLPRGAGEFQDRPVTLGQLRRGRCVGSVIRLRDGHDSMVARGSDRN